jgi:hypothetical protein
LAGVFGIDAHAAYSRLDGETAIGEERPMPSGSLFSEKIQLQGLVVSVPQGMEVLEAVSVGQSEFGRPVGIDVENTPGCRGGTAGSDPSRAECGEETVAQ